jgi:hypothetical protein
LKYRLGTGKLHGKAAPMEGGAVIDLASLRLQDFDAFAPLAQIAQRTGTEIVLHGGVACRAVMHAFYRGDTGFDLFEVTPFNSDIDLDHNGDAEKTAEILTAISVGIPEEEADGILTKDAVEIPFASWFRWSINDAEGAQLARAQRRVSTEVPLRGIRLSTEHAAEIPELAVRDLHERRVSFVRNPAFGQGGESIRPDIELYGLMMALNTWTEMQEIAGTDIDFGIDRALDWIRDGLDPSALAKAENPAFGARFWHLLSARLARVGLDRFNLTLLEAGQPLLEGLGLSIEALSDPACAFTVSKVTSAAGFRVPELTPSILTGDRARKGFEEVISRFAARIGLTRDDLPADLSELIDPALQLVAVVPELTLNPFGGDSDTGEIDADPFYSGLGQEFVQLAWDNPLGERLDPSGLTGQILVLGATDMGAGTALPLVGGTFGPDRGWVRARIDELLERGLDGGPVEAALLILQARPTGEADAGPGRHFRVREQPSGAGVGESEEKESIPGTREYAIHQIPAPAEVGQPREISRG